MNVDDPAAPWNRYAIDRASAQAQTDRAVVLSRVKDTWLVYYTPNRPPNSKVAAKMDVQETLEQDFISDSVEELFGNDFEVEASIDTEYTDGELRWNEYGLRRSQYLRKRRKIGETFDHWLRSALKAGSLRKVDFLTYGQIGEEDDGEHFFYLIAERRIVD
jgi:hypothetical protein